MTNPPVIPVTFQKIPSPFKRATEGPNRNKLIKWNYISEEISLLAALPWHWTEKINGTNIRIYWDGYQVHFGGRTDNAQIPATLATYLRETFHEELFEQKFKSPVILFGEGCGPKIQKGGGKYGDSVSFKLFDVKIGKWWLRWKDVVSVAISLGIQTTPYIGEFGIVDAINAVEDGLKSECGDFPAEGLVGRAPLGLLDRGGERLVVKVKTKDFNG